MNQVREAQMTNAVSSIAGKIKRSIANATLSVNRVDALVSGSQRFIQIYRAALFTRATFRLCSVDFTVPEILRHRYRRPV